MKRVGVVTITSGMNYGNSLQNLALILFLRDMGVEAETILNRHRCSHIPLQGVPKVKSMLTILLNYKGNAAGERLDLLRREKYLEFDRKYIPFSKTMIEGEKVPDTLKDEYDFFIAGSDIVWNPFYCTSVMFLQFARKEQRVSYAASFGVSDLPASDLERYRTWLECCFGTRIRWEQDCREMCRDVCTCTCRSYFADFQGAMGKSCSKTELASGRKVYADLLLG